MSEFIIIYGPPASGKTINASGMLQRYGCDHVCDFEEYRGGDFKRVLILTNKPGLMGTPEQPELFKSAGRLQIKLVKQDLGDRWVEPIPGYRAEAKAEPVDAVPPLFRVFWNGQEVGVAPGLWRDMPKHVDDHLFINRKGRVFWLSHKGLDDITDECRLEMLNAE
jgi:hypothetical protein